jgi:hypothetical protein
MWSKTAEKLALLKMYFDTRRGAGHTRAMIQGAINAKDVIILSHNHRYGHDLQRGCRHARIISWEDGLGDLKGRGGPLVIDNAAMAVVLGDVLDMLKELQVENALIKRQLRIMERAKEMSC